MVDGVPRICIKITDLPVEAMVDNISGSNVPADTSLMMSAPAWQAFAATLARYVSMLMAMLAASGKERMCCMTGITRESSSSSVSLVALGRVLSPPTSMIVAPAEMNSRTVAVKFS